MTPRLSIDQLLGEPEDPLPATRDGPPAGRRSSSVATVAAVVSRRSAAAGVSSLPASPAEQGGWRSPAEQGGWSPAGGPPPSPPPLRAHEGVRKAAALAATTAEQAQAIRAALPTPPDSRADSPVPASRDAMD